MPRGRVHILGKVGLSRMQDITTIRELIGENASLALALGGLLIGFAFGALAYRTNFCTMGSISDILTFGDWRRFRAWVLAAAVAIAGAQALALADVVQLSKSMYLAPRLNWSGNVLGGLMFGFGMVFAGGCASRNLVRAGGGDLRALVTLLFIGIFAYMAIGGVLGPARAALEQASSLDLNALAAETQGVGDVLAAVTSTAPPTARLTAAGLILGAALLFCFADPAFRRSPMHVVSGIGVGLCVVAGWALTGLAFDELAERPVSPVSLTYVRPTGDALEWLQRYTALGLPGFGAASVFGAILGGAAAAVAMGRFRVTGFSDRRDMGRNLFGAALMGVGGVMALGCTIGQGITGISTLALGSFVAVAAILAGGVAGMKVFEHMLLAEA
jgi:hypothetical protein